MKYKSLKIVVRKLKVNIFIFISLIVLQLFVNNLQAQPIYNLIPYDGIQYNGVTVTTSHTGNNGGDCLGKTGTLGNDVNGATTKSTFKASFSGTRNISTIAISLEGFKETSDAGNRIAIRMNNYLLQLKEEALFCNGCSYDGTKFGNCQQSLPVIIEDNKIRAASEGGFAKCMYIVQYDLLNGTLDDITIELTGTGAGFRDVGIGVFIVDCDYITAGTSGNTGVCGSSTTTINLRDLITDEDAGGSWTRPFGGTGGGFNPSAGTFTPYYGATSSQFLYTVSGTGVCSQNKRYSIASVGVTPLPNAGSSVIIPPICNTSTTEVDLSSGISGGDTYGTWTRTSGTGGSYVPGSNLFTPTDATTSNFSYTVEGRSYCTGLTDISTVGVVLKEAKPLPSVVPHNAASLGGIPNCNPGDDTTRFVNAAANTKYGQVAATTGTLGTGDFIVSNLTTITSPTVTGTSTDVQVRKTGAVGSAYATALVRRMHVLAPTLNNGGTYSVRLYYDPADISFADAQALSAAQSIDPLAVDKLGKWFKFESSLNTGSVVAAAQVADSNGFGSGTFQFYLNPTTGIENGVSYVEFNNTTSFSTFGYIAAAGSSATGTLPVTLLSFTASKQGSNALISWSTSSEQNTSYFDVEESNDGVNYRVLSKVQAVGNSNTTLSYSYIHVNPGTGTHYYRLKNVDIDGEFTYSKITTLNIGRAGTVSIFPNPARKSFTVTGIQPGIQLIVTTIEGRIVSNTIANGNIEKVDIGNLAAGVYIIKVLKKNEIINTIKLIKE